MSGQISFRDVRDGLQARALDLARELLPQGRMNGNYWIARNPMRDDRSAGSFYVWIKGAAAGGYRDEAAGEKGDCIDLIAYLSGFDKLEAKKWGERWLGLTSLSPQEFKKRQAFNEKRAREQDVQDAANLVKNQGNAKSMWLAAQKLLPGDFADLYLKGDRGIDLGNSNLAANAIRFAPKMKHMESGRTFPCVISAMSDASGGIVAVHRIWISWSSSTRQWIKIDKALGLMPPRKIWPAFRGAVIRISKGASKLSPEMAAKKGVSGPCVIVEGIEDGLAVAISRPDMRVWACGSLGNLANVPNLPCISEFIVCQDNDWDKPQAVKQFDNAIEALSATGVRVSITRSRIGKDMNDLLKGDQNDEA